MGPVGPSDTCLPQVDLSHAMDHATMPPSRHLSTGDRQLLPADMQPDPGTKGSLRLERSPGKIIFIWPVSCSSGVLIPRDLSLRDMLHGIKKFSRINLRKGHGCNHREKSHLKQPAGNFCQEESILISWTICCV